MTPEAPEVGITRRNVLLVFLVDVLCEVGGATDRPGYPVFCVIVNAQMFGSLAGDTIPSGSELGPHTPIRETGKEHMVVGRTTRLKLEHPQIAEIWKVAPDELKPCHQVFFGVPSVSGRVVVIGQAKLRLDTVGVVYRYVAEAGL